MKLLSSPGTVLSTVLGGGSPRGTDEPRDQRVQFPVSTPIIDTIDLRYVWVPNRSIDSYLAGKQYVIHNLLGSVKSYKLASHHRKLDLEVSRLVCKGCCAV